MEIDEAHRHRDELVREACRAAARRLAASTSSDPALIATGELLFWVVAGDSSMLGGGRTGYDAYRNHESRERKLLMQGLRYPRNVLAHESEAWEFDLADQYVDTYTDMYGVWTWAELSRPSTDAHHSMLTQHDAYRERLCGEPVIATVYEALEVLEEFWTRP